MRPCAICGGAQEPAYRGPVRHGTFGRAVEGQVWRCRECGVEYLPPTTDLGEYYASDAYRTDVGEQADVEDYFRRHDSEQLPRLGLLESVQLRGRVVADIGCGGGSFLDCLRGLASETVAVEPMTWYHASLAQRGHRVYANTAAARANWSGRVDFAASFSVVEHVEEPLVFLREIRELLVPGGQLLLSTPNRKDILLESGCTAYQGFFYRTVHTYYFDPASLHRLATEAGFATCDVRFVHRFGFGNYLAWLRDGRPTQHSGTSPLGARFDRAWRSQLEEAGVSDYLYAILMR